MLLADGSVDDGGDVLGLGSHNNEERRGQGYIKREDVGADNPSERCVEL